MNIKQIISIIVAIIGIFVIGYGTYSKNDISMAQVEVHKMTQSKNPIVRSVAKDTEKKIEHYGTHMKWCLYGGSLIVILGIGTAVFYRTKRKKK